MPLRDNLYDYEIDEINGIGLEFLPQQGAESINEALHGLALSQAHVKRIDTPEAEKVANELEALGSRLVVLSSRCKQLTTGPETLAEGSALASVLGKFGIEGLS